MNSILIIEDEEPIRRVLVKILEQENQSFQIHQAVDGKAGLEFLQKQTFDLVLCDIKMPKMDGMEVLEKAKEDFPNVPFIMLTGHGDVELAVEAMKLGAYDFIPKPPDLNRLLTAIRHGLDHKNLVVENKRLKKTISRKYRMVGESSALKQVQKMIEKVAPTDARVLILGDNGTGKELVAHQLHEKSQRYQAPFIEVNCAAIPPELIESELFGHLKGSFTSAIKDRPGKFEAANGGTLFLDEIADMSLSAQAKVLRALQENKIQRVGSEKDIQVNVRVVAATNKDLHKAIDAGTFREDLYHRLAVILIQVPSLRERQEDIALLAEHFMHELARDQGMEVKSFSQEALQSLEAYDWTGNIRELRNVVERLLILGDSPISKENIIQFAPK